MTAKTTPPEPGGGAHERTTRLVLAALRAHHRAGGPYTWLNAATLADRTATTIPASRHLAPDSPLRRLHRSGHIQLTHLPPRTLPHTACVDYPTHESATTTLHARLTPTPQQAQHEHDQHTTALHTIATRLGIEYKPQPDTPNAGLDATPNNGRSPGA